MKFPFQCKCLQAYSGNRWGLPVGGMVVHGRIAKHGFPIVLARARLFLVKGMLGRFVPCINNGGRSVRTCTLPRLTFCTRRILKPKDRVSFSSNRGEFNGVMIEDSKYSVNFPLLRSRPAHISPGLVEALGAYPDEVHAGANVLCVFGNEEIVTELKPDFRMLSGLHGAQGVIVTAKTSHIGYHFISRYFAPKVGIDEDHATGSTRTNWLGIGKSQRKKWWVFRFSRGAKFRCSISGNRVDLSGVAETFVRGKMIFSSFRVQFKERFW